MNSTPPGDDPYAARRADALNVYLIDLVAVMRGHDAVHPDRDVCGGVGGCLLMRTEHGARVRLTDAIEGAFRDGYPVAFGPAPTAEGLS